MPKKKGKSIPKTKKKPVRPAKRTRSKSSSRKKIVLRKQSQTASVVEGEVVKVVVMGDVEQDSLDETEAALRDPLDEHFPPDYGGSE